MCIRDRSITTKGQHLFTHQERMANGKLLLLPDHLAVANVDTAEATIVPVFSTIGAVEKTLVVNRRRILAGKLASVPNRSGFAAIKRFLAEIEKTTVTAVPLVNKDFTFVEQDWHRAFGIGTTFAEWISAKYRTVFDIDKNGIQSGNKESNSFLFDLENNWR